jgi:hydrophobic/amphiphilic exporter-1 (mainly G- bacteria), HAE1 family
MALEVVRDNSRPIRVAVANVQRTLVEGALLTVAIVFLFLNSWRSTVITGLTLPISLVGTFLAMYVFGFTINMITLMALSLCVGLLIDDAIVVRENIVRHVQMGKTGTEAALDGTQEIGLAVLATTLSIVAVFAAHRLHGRHHRQVLPRVRHHHRGGGADLDVCQLHAGPHAQRRLA